MGYYNVLDDGNSRLRRNHSQATRLTRPWQDVPALSLHAANRPGQPALTSPLQKSSPPPGQSFFFPRCVISGQLSTLLFPRPDLGQVPFLFYSSSWRPSQTARSLTSRTLSISLKLEYTSSRRDSEKAEGNQNLPQTLCE